MSVLLDTRRDLTLATYRRVAWEGEGVRIGDAAQRRMDACAASFEALVRERVAADPGALIYGVTTAPGDGAALALGAERVARRPNRIWSAVAYGDPLAPRIVRGIALARLANLLEGHAAARARVALAIAAMLEEPLPVVPAQGNGGAGEIVALGALFFELPARLELTAKERMTLINGSPCAAALVADAALVLERRIALAERVFALSSDVYGAPDAHYSADLEPLWDDEHETASLRALRALLSAAGGPRQEHQAPVSYRILPRVLGAARRAQAGAARAATISLRSVTDNPVYIPPDAQRPLGAVLSTGGYHNAHAPAAIDAAAGALADLCQLAQRHTDQLFQNPATAPLLSSEEWSIKSLHHTQNWWAEEARTHATTTVLSLAGFGQNDTPAVAFLAHRKLEAVGRCLDGALAALAIVAAQLLHETRREPPPALSPLVEEIRAHVPPVDGRARRLGLDGQGLMDAFAARVLAP